MFDDACGADGPLFKILVASYGDDGWWRREGERGQVGGKK